MSLASLNLVPRSARNETGPRLQEPDAVRHRDDPYLRCVTIISDGQLLADTQKAGLPVYPI